MIEQVECRGINFISDWLFLPVQKTGKWAVARSGFITSYESRLAAQSHAKSVTNLFTLLSVLVFRAVKSRTGSVALARNYQLIPV